MRKYILAVMVGLALLFGTPAALALADTHLWDGGNTDCTSKIYMNAGTNPNPADNNIPIAYGGCDGSFAPFLGSVNAGDAINQGVVNTRAAWDQFCSHGERCVIHGFSLGAPIATIIGNDVGADGLGRSNTHIITEGNAWGVPGVNGGKPGLIGVGINIGEPFVSVPLQIPQVPGSENRFTPNDAFAANSGQPMSAEITQLSVINGADTNGDGVQDIPPQHWIQTGTPTATFTTNDNVKQEVYGDPLPGVIAPQDNPVVNPELLPQIPNFIPDMSALPPAPADVVPVLANPADAFGQQLAGLPACVAPDGGTYFTPSGMGC